MRQTVPNPCGEIQIIGGEAAGLRVAPIHSTESSDEADLLRYRKAVGPPVIVVGPASPRESAKLSIVTWNVHVGHAHVQAFIDKYFADKTANFVLLLEEAFRRGTCVPAVDDEDTEIPGRIAPADPAPDIVEIAKANNLWLYYAPSMRNGRQNGADAQDRGNAILSTVPLSDFQAIELPFERQRRVAVAATVGVSHDIEIPVVAVHLDTFARLSEGYIFKGEAARFRQMRGLLESRDSFKNLPAVIVAGDLNGGPGQDAVQTLDESVQRRPDCEGPTFGSFLLRRTLDHIFVRVPSGWEVSPCLRLEKMESDHWPLMITLDIHSQ